MAGGLDVGRLMVREGLAHARQGYADAEAMARAAKVGIWE
jgi:endonuclease YncB( thermonuclease family)